MNEQWAIREEARPHPKLLRSDSNVNSVSVTVFAVSKGAGGG